MDFVSEAPHESGDPRHYLRLVGRWKWLLLAVVVVIPLAVFGASRLLPTEYQARTTLFVQGTSIDSGDTTNPITVSTSSPGDVARLITTPLVGTVVAKRLGDPPSEGRALARTVSATLDETGSGSTQSGFLTIVAQAGDPQRALAIAQAFADAVTTKRTRDAVNAINETVKSLSADAASTGDPVARRDILTQIQQLRGLRATQENSTQIVDPPVEPTSPVSPKPLRNAALGFILAVLLAAGLVPLLNRLDRKIRQPEELEELAGVPLLAAVPDTAFPGRTPEPRARESFQTLRAGLMSFNIDRPLSSIAVTSPARGDGKTTVAMNLAIVLAQDGRDVILVDGDLRSCQTASRLGVEGSIGLDAVLLDERSVHDGLVDVPGIEGGRLRVLPAVSPPHNPSVLLGSERMKAVMAELAEIADMVVIDTPPLLLVSDAIPLVDHVSGVVLVARIDYTARDALEKTTEVITTAGGTILGVAATGTKAGDLYGYGEYVSGSDAEVGGPTGRWQPQHATENGRGPFGRLFRRSSKGADTGARS